MATLLPNGKQQFFDGNGNPLAMGTVGFYVPNTLTPKATWQDSGESVANTNPVELDASGEAIIYGSGIYRQIVKDRDGNLIWDQPTADTASGGVAFGGVSTGTPNAQIISSSSFSAQDGQIVTFIAGLTNTSQLTVSGIPVLADTSSGPVPLSGGEVAADNAVMLMYDSVRGAFHLLNPAASTAPPGVMYPYTIGVVEPVGHLFANGQIVLRSDYFALWTAVQAGSNLAVSQGAKTAGQYGPGDGTTTFSLPNLYADDGYFIRPISSGRLIGTIQTDALKSHIHTASFAGTPVAPHTHTYGTWDGAGNAIGGGVEGSSTSVSTSAAGGFTPAGTITVNATGDTETRPKNIAYPVIIKT